VACRKLWRWAYHHVDVKLHDAPFAAELLEEVALDVSRRLQAEPAVARNLTGYLIRAFHRRVLSLVLRNNRMVYEGLLRELERNYQLAESDWCQRLSERLLLQTGTRKGRLASLP